MVNIITLMIGLSGCFFLSFLVVQYVYACGRWHERKRMVQLELQKKRMPLNSNAKFKDYEEFFDDNDILNTPIVLRSRR